MDIIIGGLIAAVVVVSVGGGVAIYLLARKLYDLHAVVENHAEHIALLRRENSQDWRNQVLG